MPQLSAVVLLLLLLPLPLVIWLSTWWHYTTAYLATLLTLPTPTVHDYIVVGSGSAGSVVAARLAEAGHSVLMIEAGGPAPALAHIPSFVGVLQNTPIDWAYR